MTLSYTKLTSDQLESALAGLAGWEIKDGMLSKTFSQPSYAAGVVFGSAVGHLADKLNHHPDLMIGYQRVTVSLTTHDAGGITSYDVELATRIEAIA